MSLRALIPPHILPGTMNDDQLGVWLANNILKGEWLGPWTVDSLSKPAGYSLFLAVCKTLSLNPTLTIHLIYLITLLGFVKIIMNLFIGRIPLSEKIYVPALFAFLAFNPALFADEFSRVYRTSLFTVLVLILICFSYHIIFHFNKIIAQEKSGKNELSLLFIYVFFAGVSYGLMLITRNDSFWAIIGLFCFTTYTYLSGIIRVKKSGIKQLVLKLATYITILIVFFIASWIPQKIVKDLNAKYYGVGLVEDFYTGEFARAWKELTRIQATSASPDFISISKEQRAIAYRVSPSFFTLKPVLDGEPNTGWKVYSCAANKICDDSGQWLTFEMRSAAVNIHQIDSERSFQEFFKKVATEIENACNDREIVCQESSLSAGSKPIWNYNKMHLVKNAFGTLFSLMNMEQGRPTSSPVEIVNPMEKILWAQVISLPEGNVAGGLLSRYALSLVSFLSNIFTILVYCFSFFTLVGLANFRRVSKHVARISMLIFISIFLYLLVLAVFESSVGSGVALSLYALPIQPLFLLFIGIGFLNSLEFCARLKAKIIVKN